MVVLLIVAGKAKPRATRPLTLHSPPVPVPAPNCEENAEKMEEPAIFFQRGSGSEESSGRKTQLFENRL